MPLDIILDADDDVYHARETDRCASCNFLQGLSQQCVLVTSLV
jgi:hypothetical protein